MNHKIRLTLLLLISAAMSLSAQQIPGDTLKEKFEHYREKVLTEKVYAHLDRSFYLTGETLWFKLYNVDGTLHRPLDVSTVAYAELLTHDNKPVLQAKIELKGGLGNGSFFLPASLSNGNYKFRVYTNWMKNFSPEYYYSQIIGIVNPFLTPDTDTDSPLDACSVEFFPEGGSLVSGITSKVAFKTHNRSPKGRLCHGVIEDNAGEVIASFSPEKYGMGTFTITPKPGVTYRAVMTGPSGARRIFPFPEVQPSGYTMNLRDSSGFVTVTVETRGVDDKHIYLFAHARHIISHAVMLSLANNRAVFRLDKEDFAGGVSHITVFNERLQPVSERLFFTHPRQELDIQIATSQKTFAPRKKASVSIQTKHKDMAVPANASISVYRIDSLVSHHGPGIHPYLWLSSDLAGSVDSPGYYFTNAAGVEAHTDNLMLTHGWRRFSWHDVLEKEPSFRYVPEVRDHIVTAVVSANEKKRRGVFTYLGSPGEIVRAYGAWTNADGEARFEIKDFYGPRRIIVQTSADSTDWHDIRIVDPFSVQYDTKPVPALVIDDKMEGDLQTRSIAMQVQDIYYYDSYGTKTEIPVVDSSAFYGQADAMYLLDDYTRFPLMEEVMREYVPGVFVRKRKTGFHFVLVDYVNGGLLSGDPMVLLDGVPVPDVDAIMKVDPLRVKKLEVVKRPYYLGQSAFSGIVSYTTYNGDLGGLELDPRSVSLDYDGLQMKRIFHKPVYTRDRIDDRLPDQRVLLHWEPRATTGQDGTYTAEFYTSDVPGQYLIVVEGITHTGLSGTATYTFTVSNPDAQ